MSEIEKVEGFYQVRAKEIIDLLFDKKFFADDVNRTDMQAVEDFLAYSFQVQCRSAVKCALLSKSIKDK